MPKHTHSNSQPDPEPQEHAASGDTSFTVPADVVVEAKNDDMMAKAATIAVVGVGVALISTELLPGMLIGVAAALLPGIGPKVRPLVKGTIKAGYAAVRKTREMLAEAGEQVQDMLAEARSEEAPPVPTPPAGGAKHPA